MSRVDLSHLTFLEKCRYWWAVLTCNWFVLGLTCHIKGHSRREYPLHGALVSDCGRCGRFFGSKGHTKLVEQQLEQLRQVKLLLAEVEEFCPEHGDDDPITCGWKRTVLSIRSVLLTRKERIEEIRKSLDEKKGTLPNGI